MASLSQFGVFPLSSVSPPGSACAPWPFPCLSVAGTQSHAAIVACQYSTYGTVKQVRGFGHYVSIRCVKIEFKFK